MNERIPFNLQTLNELEDTLYLSLENMLHGDEEAKEHFLVITRMLRKAGLKWRKDAINGVVIY